MNILKPLPHSILRPKPQRLPRPIKVGPKDNRLTLVVGLKCHDAVVLAAETEESVGITAKRNVYKLDRISGDDWTLVVGGAGDSVIAANATRRIARGLKDHNELTDEVLCDVIDDVLAAVHTKYIDTDPTSDGIGLIIGAVTSDNELHLISTQKRAFQFQDRYAYAGVGVDLAIYFLDRLYDHSFSWEDAAKVAGFVLMQVKEASQFCSGESQIYALQVPPNPRWRSLGSWAVLDIENNCNTLVSSFTEEVLKELRSFSFAQRIQSGNEYFDYEEEESDDSTPSQ